MAAVTPQERFAAQLAVAGITPEKPLHAVLWSMHEAALAAQGAAKIALEAAREGRKPLTQEELRAMGTDLFQWLVYHWQQMNRRAVAICAAGAVLFGAACGVTGWYLKGPITLLAGIKAAAQECQDYPDGSRLCRIPVWERLPPVQH